MNGKLCGLLIEKIENTERLIQAYQQSTIFGSDNHTNVDKLIALSSALDEAREYIKRYSDSSYVSRILNVVIGQEEAEEVFQIDKKINESITSLAGCEHLSSKLNLSWENISEHLNLSYRDEIFSHIQKLEPLSYNPSRDILFKATTTGKSFREDEIAAFNEYLLEGDQEKLLNMFKHSRKRSDEELGKYYKKYYPNTFKPNVATLISEAIKCRQNTNLDKYIQEDTNFFVGKILSIRFPDLYNQPYLYGEVILCEKKLNENNHQTLTFRLLTDNVRFQRQVSIVLISSGFSVKTRMISCQSFSSFFRDLDADSGTKFSDRVIDLKLRQNAMKSVNSLFPPGKYDLKVSVENPLAARFATDRRKFKVKLNSSSTGSESSTPSLVYVFVYEGGKNCLFRQYTTHKNGGKTEILQKEISLHELDVFTLCMDGTTDSITYLLSPSEIEIKEKRQTELQTRLILGEKIASLRRELVDLLSDTRSSDLDKVIIFLNLQRKLTFNPDTPEVEFLKGWISELHHSIHKYIDDLFENYEKLIKSDGLPNMRFRLLTEIIFDANRLRLLKSRSESRDAVELMDRLSNAVDFLKDLYRKDLILFVGDTGAGKSTSINYFLGIPLEYDEDNYKKIRVADDAEGKDYAEIGVFNSISQTIYVRGYPIQNEELREYYRSEVPDIDNLRLCDCPGFHDTRGEGYDLTAALSISRGIALSNSLKGIVLVVPEKEFRSRKGRGVIEAFEKLEEMMTEQFDEMKDIKSNVYLIVSLSEPYQSLKTFNEISQIINSCCQENENNNSRDLIRRRIWSFIQQLLKDGHVLVIDIDNTNDKANWLKSCMASKKSIPKDKIKPLLEMSSVHRSFSSTITNSLFIWEHMIYRRYSEIMQIPKRTEALIKEYDSQKNEHNNQIIRIRDLRKNFDQQKMETQNEIYKLRKLLENGDGNNDAFDSTLVLDIQDKAKTRNNLTIQQKREDIEQKTVEIRNLERDIDNLVAFIQVKNDAKQGTYHSLTNLKKERKELSEGNANIEVAHLKPFQYQDEVTLRFEKSNWRYYKEYFWNLTKPDQYHHEATRVGTYSGKKIVQISYDSCFRSFNHSELKQFLGSKNHKFTQATIPYFRMIPNILSKSLVMVKQLQMK